MTNQKFIPQATDLVSLFPLSKGGAISVVGTGGKTSLVYALAKAYGVRGSAVIASSAKMGVPKLANLTFYQGKLPSRPGPGLYAYAPRLVHGVKMDSIREADLARLKETFDATLIEADGSRRLPIKFWKDHEPPVLEGTDVTIGVFPLKAFGLPISPETTYHLEGFRAAFPGHNCLTPALIEKICLHPGGLFKNARGLKEIYISGVDSPEDAVRLAAYAQNWHSLRQSGLGLACGGTLTGRVYRIYPSA